MNTFIAILRGINVSGKNKIKMDELKSLCSKWGLEQVTTYIQSGNLCFATDEESSERLEQIIKNGIEEHWGYDVPVLVLSSSELNEIIDNCPFSAHNETKSIYYTILNQTAISENCETLLSYDYRPDIVRIGNRVVYVLCPGGYGKTKFNNTFIEKKLKVSATTRNWNTMRKLQTMIASTTT